MGDFIIPVVKFVDHWVHILFHLTRANKVTPIPYGNDLIPNGNKNDPSGSQIGIHPNGK